MLQAGFADQLLKAAVDDQRPALQFANINGGFPAAPVIFSSHHGNHRFSRSIHAFEAGAVERGADNTDFNDSRIQQIKDHIRIAFVDFELDPGIHFMEFKEPVLQQGGGRRGDGSD
ncbi:hypothetical protein D3C75_833120 [compost metagenome]